MRPLRAVFISLVLSRRVCSFIPAGGGINAAGSPRKVGYASRSVRFRASFPMATNVSDGVGESKGVGFASNTPGKAEEDAEEEGLSALQTVNRRLLAQIEQQGKGIVIPTEDSKKIQRREEDLNGVNPFYAILGAVVAGAMSFGSWKATLWFANAYYSKPAPESDILAVARLTAFLKQAVVGMFALGSGVFGVNALGMGIMAGIVAVGVVKGELDPSPGATASKTAPAGASAEEVDRVMLKEAEEKILRAQADIDRELGGKTRR